MAKIKPKTPRKPWSKTPAKTPAKPAPKTPSKSRLKSPVKTPATSRTSSPSKLAPKPPHSCDSYPTKNSSTSLTISPPKFPLKTTLQLAPACLPLSWHQRNATSPTVQKFPICIPEPDQTQYPDKARRYYGRDAKTLAKLRIPEMAKGDKGAVGKGWEGRVRREDFMVLVEEAKGSPKKGSPKKQIPVKGGKDKQKGGGGAGGSETGRGEKSESGGRGGRDERRRGGVGKLRTSTGRVGGKRKRSRSSSAGAAIVVEVLSRRASRGSSKGDDERPRSESFEGSRGSGGSDGQQEGGTRDVGMEMDVIDGIVVEEGSLDDIFWDASYSSSEIEGPEESSFAGNSNGSSSCSSPSRSSDGKKERPKKPTSTPSFSSSESLKSSSSSSSSSSTSIGDSKSGVPKRQPSRKTHSGSSSGSGKSNTNTSNTTSWPPSSDWKSLSQPAPPPRMGYPPEPSSPLGLGSPPKPDSSFEPASSHKQASFRILQDDSESYSDFETEYLQFRPNETKAKEERKEMYKRLGLNLDGSHPDNHQPPFTPSVIVCRNNKGGVVQAIVRYGNSNVEPQSTQSILNTAAGANVAQGPDPESHPGDDDDPYEPPVDRKSCNNPPVLRNSQNSGDEVDSASDDLSDDSSYLENAQISDSDVVEDICDEDKISSNVNMPESDFGSPLPLYDTSDGMISKYWSPNVDSPLHKSTVTPLELRSRLREHPTPNSNISQRDTSPLPLNGDSDDDPDDPSEPPTSTLNRHPRSKLNFQDPDRHPQHIPQAHSNKSISSSQAPPSPSRRIPQAHNLNPYTSVPHQPQSSSPHRCLDICPTRALNAAPSPPTPEAIVVLPIIQPYILVPMPYRPRRGSSDEWDLSPLPSPSQPRNSPSRRPRALSNTESASGHGTGAKFSPIIESNDPEWYSLLQGGNDIPEYQFLGPSDDSGEFSPNIGSNDSFSIEPAGNEGELPLDNRSDDGGFIPTFELAGNRNYETLDVESGDDGWQSPNYSLQDDGKIPSYSLPGVCRTPYVRCTTADIFGALPNAGTEEESDDVRFKPRWRLKLISRTPSPLVVTVPARSQEPVDLPFLSQKESNDPNKNSITFRLNRNIDGASDSSREEVLENNIIGGPAEPHTNHPADDLDQSSNTNHPDDYWSPFWNTDHSDINPDLSDSSSSEKSNTDAGKGSSGGGDTKKSSSSKSNLSINSANSSQSGYRSITRVSLLPTNRSEEYIQGANTKPAEAIYSGNTPPTQLIPNNHPPQSLLLSKHGQPVVGQSEFSTRPPHIPGELTTSSLTVSPHRVVEAEDGLYGDKEYIGGEASPSKAFSVTQFDAAPQDVNESLADDDKPPDMVSLWTRGGAADSSGYLRAEILKPGVCGEYISNHGFDSKEIDQAPQDVDEFLADGTNPPDMVSQWGKEGGEGRKDNPRRHTTSRVSRPGTYGGYIFPNPGEENLKKKRESLRELQAHLPRYAGSAILQPGTCGRYTSSLGGGIPCPPRHSKSAISQPGACGGNISHPNTNPRGDNLKKKYEAVFRRASSFKVLTEEGERGLQNNTKAAHQGLGECGEAFDSSKRNRELSPIRNTAYNDNVGAYDGSKPEDRDVDEIGGDGTEENPRIGEDTLGEDGTAENLGLGEDEEPDKVPPDDGDESDGDGKDWSGGRCCEGGGDEGDREDWSGGDRGGGRGGDGGGGGGSGGGFWRNLGGGDSGEDGPERDDSLCPRAVGVGTYASIDATSDSDSYYLTDEYSKASSDSYHSYDWDEPSKITWRRQLCTETDLDKAPPKEEPRREKHGLLDYTDTYTNTLSSLLSSWTDISDANDLSKGAMLASTLEKAPFENYKDLQPKYYTALNDENRAGKGYIVRIQDESSTGAEGPGDGFPFGHVSGNDGNDDDESDDDGPFAGGARAINATHNSNQSSHAAFPTPKGHDNDDESNDNGDPPHYGSSSPSSPEFQIELDELFKSVPKSAPLRLPSGITQQMFGSNVNTLESSDPGEWEESNPNVSDDWAYSPADGSRWEWVSGDEETLGIIDGLKWYIGISPSRKPSVEPSEVERGGSLVRRNAIEDPEVGRNSSPKKRKAEELPPSTRSRKTRTPGPVRSPIITRSTRKTIPPKMLSRERTYPRTMKLKMAQAETAARMKALTTKTPHTILRKIPGRTPGITTGHRVHFEDMDSFEIGRGCDETPSKKRTFDEDILDDVGDLSLEVPKRRKLNIRAPPAKKKGESRLSKYDM